MNISYELHDICMFSQRTAAANLGVNDLNPNSLAGKEVSVAGWGKTRSYYESKKSQLVSNMHRIYSLGR